MKIGLFKSTCAKNGIKIMELFCEGIKKVGDTPLYLDDISDNIDIAVVWSVLWTNPIRKKIYEYYFSKKIPIIIIEVGGILRNKTWRIGLNNINGTGLFPFDNKKRWHLFNKKVKNYSSLLKNKIIICGQNEFSYNWPKQYNTESWVKNLISKIRKYTDKEIIFSQHPRFPVKFKEKLDCEIIYPKFIGNYDQYNLEETLNDCCLLINYNSNSGLDGVFNGVNVYVDKTSLCYDVSIKNICNINNLSPVDRSEWLEKIAYTEWFEEEIQEGIPLLHIKKLLKELKK